MAIQGDNIINIYLFIYWGAVAGLSCGMWDLLAQPETELEPPELRISGLPGKSQNDNVLLEEGPQILSGSSWK